MRVCVIDSGLVHHRYEAMFEKQIKLNVEFDEFAARLSKVYQGPNTPEAQLPHRANNDRPEYPHFCDEKGSEDHVWLCVAAVCLALMCTWSAAILRGASWARLPALCQSLHLVQDYIQRARCGWGAAGDGQSCSVSQSGTCLSVCTVLVFKQKTLHLYSNSITTLKPH